MKVLVISHSCVVDVNQQVYVELNRLNDVEVMLMIPAIWKSEYSGETIMPKILTDVSFPVLKMPVVKPGHISLHFYRQLPLTEIRAFRPDIILSTQEPWSLSGLQAMYLSSALGIPFVFQTNQNIEKRYPPPFGWIEAASFRRVAMALAYSEEARQVMLRKGLKQPSQVVPYATDTRLFQPADTTALRQRLGLDGKTVIGYLGRLVPEKGVDTLLDALALLRDQRGIGKQVAVLLVGSGSAEESLKEQAKRLNLTEQVVFAGSVPHTEAAAYMACLDIFVLPSRTTPSWKEQFGRVIIEALACGVPVAGSDSGQIPHLIRETGGGAVFPEGNAEALAEILAKWVENPDERKQLVQTGQHAVQERFTCEAVAFQLHQILKSRLASGTGKDPRDKIVNQSTA
ncbi:MAG: glycosyltransferase family 4 protein [Armatimonadaceae bacterium]